MTENKPVWKPGKKPDSPYLYADWDKLAKEEPNTILLLQKEERYSNQDGKYKYWVNYHQKYGWSVSRKAITPEAEDDDHVAEVKTNGTIVEKPSVTNGSFEYRAYWEKRQAFEEEKHKEIKKQHMENILLGHDMRTEIKELKEEVKLLRTVFQEISGAISTLAYALTEGKKT